MDTTTKQPSAFPRLAPSTENEWLDWARTKPALIWSETFDSERRVVVVSPHPDDETLACGALIAELHARKHDVLIVAVTEGEGSHPEVAELASLRRAEQSAALGRLGHHTDPVRLGLPDAGVVRHAAGLRNRLLTLVGPDDVLLAPWSHDGHTDHDACGSAAEAVAAASGCALLEYPVWAWQWATRRDLDAAPWERFEGSPPARRAKASALDCFPSQTTDRFGEIIVDGAALARFRRPFEVYARVG